MSTGATLFIAVFGGILALALWRVTTIQTGPAGHTLLETFIELRAANEARGVLEGAGIGVILEDHRPNRVFRGTAMPPGSVNLFVSTDDVQRAAHVLREAAKAHHHGPPA